jgi:hypothetical protein
VTIWHREGRIIDPDAVRGTWIGTHAALPVLLAAGTRHRLYFSSRDEQSRSRIGWADLGGDGSQTPQRFSARAVLEPGALGTFDDAGVTSSCAVEYRDRVYLYYTGWSLGTSVPFYLNIGVAVSDDGESFHRLSRAPLLERTDAEPFLTASPWILVENAIWRMWYVCGTGWTRTSEGPRHNYHIRYAESPDGLVWRRTGAVAIDYGGPDEYAFGRPCVVRDGSRYRMWYSSRGRSYRIGYAESADGIKWRRMDDRAGIDVAASGWDSEMITYPCVVPVAGVWRMFYNGNGYGRTGIGVASADVLD